MVDISILIWFMNTISQLITEGDTTLWKTCCVCARVCVLLVGFCFVTPEGRWNSSIQGNNVETVETHWFVKQGHVRHNLRDISGFF